MKIIRNWTVETDSLGRLWVYNGKGVADVVTLYHDGTIGFNGKLPKDVERYVINILKHKEANK